MKTKSSLLSLFTSPVRCAGLFCVVMLSGCQTTPPPDQVALKFWQDLAQGQVVPAKSQATKDSQAIVNITDIDKLSPVTTGEAFVDDDDTYAAVLTTINRNNKPVTFNTALRNEDDGWKVDIQQTHTNIAMRPFDGLFRSLQNLGATFARQLEQQLPQIEKELKTQLPIIEREVKTQLPLIQKEMQSKLPLIEKQMESVAGQMQQQIEQLGRTLKKQPYAPLVKPSKPAYP